MLLLSEVMIAHTDIDSFEDLTVLIKHITRSGNERFFRMDVKPDYADTPENWEDRLEAVFY